MEHIEFVRVWAASCAIWLQSSLAQGVQLLLVDEQILQMLVEIYVHEVGNGDQTN